jgi:hypothetical protein
MDPGEKALAENLPILKAIPHLSRQQLTPLINFGSKSLIDTLLLLSWNLGEGALEIEPHLGNIFIKHRKILKPLKTKRLPKRLKRAILSENPTLTKALVTAALPHIQEFKVETENHTTVSTPPPTPAPEIKTEAAESHKEPSHHHHHHQAVETAPVESDWLADLLKQKGLSLNDIHSEPKVPEAENHLNEEIRTSTNH